MPYDQLRLLDAWEAWDIPITQQREWITQLWGTQDGGDLLDLVDSPPPSIREVLRVNTLGLIQVDARD